MDKIRCSNGKQFVLYHTAEACEPASYEISYIEESIVVLAISCITCAALTYKYKMEIKIWMYHTNVLSSWVTEQSIANTKEYTAFVCFSKSEDKFVKNKLMPQLEGSNPSFKLCIHTRDWNAGDHIPSRIRRSVANSQCTIIVLSQSFLKSFYCREELQTAWNQSLEDKSHRIFLIPLEEIATEELDNELRGYINECLHIPWKDNEWFWKKLRYLISHQL